MQLIQGNKGAFNGLSDESGKFFDKIVTEYEIQDEAGLKLLRLACEALDIVRDCERIIADEGRTYRDRFDQPKAHPLCAVERDARSQFAMFLNKLELEPEIDSAKKRSRK